MTPDIDTNENLKQVNQMTISEVEPMYWVLEDSLYENKTKRAEAMFQLLCCAAKYRKSLIQSLHPGQRERLKQIAHELYGENGYQKRKSIEIRMPLTAKKLPFRRELELQEYLSHNPKVLSDAVGEEIRVVGTEVKTDCEYACDIVAEGRLFYPIELKIGQTTHGVVSQIEKYCFYFYRTLRYNRYKEIQGIVIGNGFCSWSINALRKNYIRIFDIIPVDKKNISLREIS